MPSVKYLGHEIRVSPGTSRSAETAFVKVDGADRVFLGGEAEARTFLRDRKIGTFYGPRPATWEIALADSNGSGATVVWLHARMLETVAYFAREGRACIVTRVELCPAPGCDGYGDITVPIRRGMVSHKPCACHAPVEEVVELC